MRNASERKDIRRAEKLAAETERARIEFICAAMSTKQGRTWFHALLAGCSLFQDPFTGDALMDNFVKGQRNIGLMIYNDIVGNCPADFVTMMQEASIQEQINDRPIKPSDDIADPFGDEYASREDIYGGDN